MSQKTAAGSRASRSRRRSRVQSRFARRRFALSGGSAAAPAIGEGRASVLCDRSSDGRATASSGTFSGGSLLVVAFEGWNDAGEAASGAARAIRDQLELVPVVELEPEDYFDYQFNRPTVSIDETGDRVLEWPSVTLYGPGPESIPTESGLAVHVLLGTEPSRGWKTFAAEVVDAIEAADVTAVVFLGAMLADVPHTRPISVFASSENAAVRDRFELERSSYEGPVGILSVLSDAAERAGIPTLSIWASVPHYVHNAPSPKAMLALIERLEEFVDLEVARGDLLEESRRHGRAGSTRSRTTTTTWPRTSRSSSRRVTPSTRPRPAARRSPRSSSATCAAVTGATAATAAAVRPRAPERGRPLPRAGSGCSTPSDSSTISAMPSSDAVDHERQERVRLDVVHQERDHGQSDAERDHGRGDGLGQPVPGAASLGLVGDRIAGERRVRLVEPRPEDRRHREQERELRRRGPLVAESEPGRGRGSRARDARNERQHLREADQDAVAVGDVVLAPWCGDRAGRQARAGGRTRSARSRRSTATGTTVRMVSCSRKPTITIGIVPMMISHPIRTSGSPFWMPAERRPPRAPSERNHFEMIRPISRRK